MDILSTSPVIHADIWKEDSIVSDIWSDQVDLFNPTTISEIYADYYLSQMNFLNGIE